MKLYPVIKSIVDKVGAIVLLVLTLPITLPVAVCLLIVNRGKVFFYQPRPGKNGKVFTIVKFKTMNDRKDKEGNLLPNYVRMTKVGRIVRKLSIDELAQLINVLKGDMSFVGPRPLLVDYLPLYSKEQARRHDVKPGITGWAQVNGRNTISWKKKFEYDVYYVDNQSLALDIKIVFLTLKKVLMRSDVNSSENVTMERFNGKN